MEIRCHGCMKSKKQSPICEHCGFDERSQNSNHQLPVGTVVGGQYTLGKVLGQGGFGITYIGWDNILNIPVAVKEYFPSGYAGRDTRDPIRVTSYDTSDKHAFENNKMRFLREAESLAKLWNIPQIVRVLRHFEENGTAYIAMEYVEGMDLRRYVKKMGRPMTVDELMHTLGPIMEALSHAHKADLVHRDISPDNIMVTPDGGGKLLDFGAARYVENSDAEHDRNTSTQAILKHGFAPPEQYHSHGALGPWTDVYAMCATIYFCLTGKVPVEAMNRMMDDTEVGWEQVPGLSKHQQDVLNKGMELKPKNRIKSVMDLHDGLFAEILAAREKAQKDALEAQVRKEAEILRKEQERKEAERRAEEEKLRLEQEQKQKEEFRRRLEAERQLTQQRKEEEQRKREAEQAEAKARKEEAERLKEEQKREAQERKEAREREARERKEAKEREKKEAQEARRRTREEASVSTRQTSTSGAGQKKKIPVAAIAAVLVLLIGIAVVPGMISGGKEETKPAVAGETRVPEAGGLQISPRLEMDGVELGHSQVIPVLSDHAPEKLKWSTSDPGIAQVAQDGTVTAMGYGHASITVSYKNQSATCSVGIYRKGNVSCTYEENETGITITGFTGQLPSDMVLPLKIDGKYVTAVGDMAFSGCEGLRSVIIPDSVTAIGDYAFAGCISLKDMTIPETVTSIGGLSFYETAWLNSRNEDFVICGDGVLIQYNGGSTNVTVPGDVKQISGAFFECSNLISVEIPQGVTAIGKNTFAGCVSLRNVTIPQGVTSIGAYTFESCTALQSITIPDSVREIQDCAFYDCTALGSVELPKSLVSLGNKAFYGCSALSDVTIPDTVASIGGLAFQNTPWLAGRTEEFVICGDGVLIRYNGRATQVTVPEQVKRISGAFYECADITGIKLPQGLKSIGMSAFEGCTHLTDLIIPQGVTTIGNAAFSGCTALTSVEIPQGVIHIGDDAFFHCIRLARVTIPQSVRIIGTNAFHSCEKLENVTIPQSVRTIKNLAFGYCIRLTDVVIPEGVTALGDYAFFNCSSLKNVTISQTVRTIGTNAFDGCDGLKKVAVPESCILGAGAFGPMCEVSYY